ncbi:MAG: class II aldolase/adducin family protein [Candidatus Sericytochromatia bacterium]|nr:class II aldolase/adducin family protein [Candidatus Sericytochromatia bacterium]
MTTEWQARRAIVEVCRAMYGKGFLAATDGNVSIRLGSRILVTPTGVAKGRLAAEDLIVTDLAGRVQGRGAASSEMALHTEAYARRPDVGAVVHGHPPRAIAFTVAGRPIPGRMLPEVVVSFGGDVPTVPYTTPTTAEVPAALGPVLARHDVVMMEWHGAVCLGPDVWEAYHKLEKLEHLCEVALFAEQLGGGRLLSDAQLTPLLALHRAMRGRQ